VALVPDDAIMRMAELKSPSAFNLYVYYCRWRDHGTGYVFGDKAAPREAAAGTGINLTYISTLKKQLTAAGWIAEEGGRVKVMVGDFNVGRKGSEYPRRALQTGSNISSFGSNISSGNSNISSGNSNISSPLLIESSTPPAHTPAPEPLGNFERQGVGVGSAFTWPEVLEWARAMKKQDPTIRSAESLAVARLKDGMADHSIREYFSPAPKHEDKADPFEGVPLELCPNCYGAKFEVVPGKGARKCSHPRLLEVWLETQQQKASA
jgi:hypothetical protein